MVVAVELEGALVEDGACNESEDDNVLHGDDAHIYYHVYKVGMPEVFRVISSSAAVQPEYGDVKFLYDDCKLGLKITLVYDLR